MSNIDVNKIQQNVKELQDQNAIDFQQWKKLGKDIEKLSEKIKLSDTNLNMLMKKIKNDYEKMKKIIIDENIQVQLNNKIEKNKNEIVDNKNKIDYVKIKAEENSNKIEQNKNEINKKVNIETFENKVDEISSQLDSKASKTELQTQTERIDNFTTLAEGSTTGDAELIDGRTVNGVTYSNIGGAIRSISNGAGIKDNSIGVEKIKEKDFVTYYDKWNKMTSNTDSSGNWCNNYIYKKGYVKTIKLKINGTEEQTGKVYLYQYYNDGTIQVKGEFSVSGVGEIYINIDKYIEYDFLISSNIENVAYSSETGYTSAQLGHSIDKFTPNFKFSYVFAVGIEYTGIKHNISNLLKKQQLINLNPCKVLPHGNNQTYPIIIDFENMTFKMNSYIVKDFKKYKNDFEYMYVEKTLPINNLPTEGYYVIIVTYNPLNDEISIIYSNGESLQVQLSLIENNQVICYGLTNGKTYFSFGNINEDYMKVILKQSLNTDVTTDDDKVIPKFGEKLILTRKIQKNKWFNKKVNFLGDSVTKGENSADSYKRMKDDNIASIVKEHFGFSVARNYGIGGSRITTHGGNNNGMIDRYNNMDNDADLIVLWGGTNDFGGNVEIGNLNLNNLTDNTKFKTAFYNLLKALIEKYPGKQLLVITPMHRKDGKPDNVTNSAGHVLKDYRNAEIEIAELLGIPVLDMWSELGGTPFIDSFKTNYMPDGLHPSILGMRTYVGERICNKIKNI